LAAFLVGGDSIYDGTWVTADNACDLGKAVASFRVVTDEPPELLACGGYGSRSVTPAELVAGNAP
jgi:hypothetical protein